MSQANPLICHARTYERILYPHDLLSFQLFNHVHLYIHLSYHQFILFETSQHELQPASTPSTNLKICQRALMQQANHILVTEGKRAISHVHDSRPAPIFLIQQTHLKLE